MKRVTVSLFLVLFVLALNAQDAGHNGFSINLGAVGGGFNFTGNPSTGEIFTEPALVFEYGLNLGAEYQFGDEFSLGFSSTILAGGITGIGPITYVDFNLYPVFGNKVDDFALGPLFSTALNNFGAGIIVFYKNVYLSSSALFNFSSSLVDFKFMLGYSIYLGK